MELSLITQLANRQLELEDEVATIEEQLKLKKQELRAVAEKDLPEALLNEGVEQIKLENGRVISIKTSYHASIPEARKGEAFGWLRANGYDGIIKRDVIAKFGKGEDDLAGALFNYLRKKLPNVEVTDKETVHASTLKAFVKERIEEGENIPMEAFGVFVVTEAKIK